MSKKSFGFNVFTSIALPILLLILTAQTFAGSEIEVNNTAPNITLRDLNEKLVFCKTILEKKPIIVSFFYTNCVPCKKEIPDLQKLYDKYNSKIAFFLIATDKEGADIVEPYIQKLGVTIPVLIDKFSDVVKDFGITKYPTLLIIGRDGKIKYLCSGYKEENLQLIENIIKELK